MAGERSASCRGGALRESGCPFERAATRTAWRRCATPALSQLAEGSSPETVSLLRIEKANVASNGRRKVSFMRSRAIWLKRVAQEKGAQAMVSVRALRVGVDCNTDL